MNYKNILDILKRNGAEKIEMPSSDAVPFIKYLTKSKYKDKVYVRIERGKFIVSNIPLTITTKTQLS